MKGVRTIIYATLAKNITLLLSWPSNGKPIFWTLDFYLIENRWNYECVWKCSLLIIFISWRSNKNKADNLSMGAEHQIMDVIDLLIWNPIFLKFTYKSLPKNFPCSRLPKHAPAFFHWLDSLYGCRPLSVWLFGPLAFSGFGHHASPVLSAICPRSYLSTM